MKTPAEVKWSQKQTMSKQHYTKVSTNKLVLEGTKRNLRSMTHTKGVDGRDK